MVLEFGLLNPLFEQSNQTGEGLGADRQETAALRVFDEKDFTTFLYDTGAATNGMILCFTPKIWCQVNGTSTRRTTNAGLTWAAATTDNAATNNICCRSKTPNSLKGVATNGNTSWKTTDGGDNWSVSTTPIASTITKVLMFSCPSDSLFVAACDIATAARGIFYSNDGGDVWTLCTSGPAVDTFAVAMFDNTTGYAVDSAGNIWKTTNGAVDWTDTTHNVTGVGTMGINMHAAFAPTATTMIFSVNSTRLELYNNTAGTVTVKLLYPLSTIPAAGNIQSNFVRTENGDIFRAVQFYADTAGIDTGHIVLYRSKDKGVTWGTKIFQTPAIDGSAASAVACDTCLEEAGANKLVMHCGKGTYIAIEAT